MKKFTVSFKLTESQFKHFNSICESEGCESVTELFRHAGFRLWPMGKTGSSKSSDTKSQLSHNLVATKSQLSQEEKNEEREKSPHTPLKEKEISPAPDPVPAHHACACESARARNVSFGAGSGSVDFSDDVFGSGSGTGSAHVGSGPAKRVKVDRDFIMYSQFDPVSIALNYAEAVLQGKTWRDMGLEKYVFYRRLKKIETFFRQSATHPPKTIA